MDFERRVFLSPPLHLLLVVLLCVTVFVVFRPGNYSQDSLDQYRQAAVGLYRDWHPPLMAIILRGFLLATGSASPLILLQCLLGGVGVYGLARAAAALRLPDRGHSSLVGLVVFLVLFLPFSPMAVYLVTFWKDSWCAVTFLWCGIFLLLLSGGGSRAGGLRFASTLGGFSLSLAVGLALRHNLFIALPASLAACFRAVLRPGPGRPAAYRRAAAWCAVPLLLCLLFKVVPSRLFAIESTHPVQQVLVHDMVGAIVLDPAIAGDLPFISSRLAEGYRDRFRFGTVSPIYFSRDSVLKSPPPYGSEMRESYLRLLTGHPRVYLSVKLRAFAELLRTDRTFYWFHPVISPNDMGLSQDPRFSALRSLWVAWSLRAVQSPLRWLFALHLPWLILNASWVLLCLLPRRKAGNADVMTGLVLLVPLSYYLSYLFAATAWDFRFMYPSTLMVQVLLLSAAVRRVIAALTPRIREGTP